MKKKLLLLGVLTADQQLEELKEMDEFSAELRNSELLDVGITLERVERWGGRRGLAAWRPLV